MDYRKFFCPIFRKRRRNITETFTTSLKMIARKFIIFTPLFLNSVSNKTPFQGQSHVQQTLALDFAQIHVSL